MEQPISIDPQEWLNEARTAFAAGNHATAREAAQKALERNASLAEGWHILAASHQAQGQPAKAEPCYREALLLDAGQIMVWLNHASCLMALGRWDEAEGAVEHALGLNARHGLGRRHKATILSHKGDVKTAEQILRDLVAERPTDADAWIHLGILIHGQDRLDEAEDAYRKAYALQPSHPGAGRNLTAVLRGQAKFEEAARITAELLAKTPNDPELNLQYATTLLTLGRWHDAWPYYEWRSVRNRTLNRPQWRGEDLAGKTILIHAEQGLGDTIMFARYVPMVKALGARTIFMAQKALLPLFERGLAGVDQFLPLDEKEAVLPRVVDYHSPLMSLPRSFNTMPETIPDNCPYIVAPPVFLLRPKRRPHVGIVWAGNPDYPNDKNRSMRFSDFAPLFDIQGVDFYSFQMGAAKDQAQAAFAQNQLIDLSGQLTDFGQTALLLQSMDLIISVDTALAHLAGAMAKPIWMMIAFMPDFRWMLDKETTRWYPTARLFRQPRHNDWRSVIERIGDELVNKIKNNDIISKP